LSIFFDQFLFLEGTCTNRACLITYKTGAFLPALPVQPVIIQYDENKFNFPVWTWVNPSKMRIIFYTLCQLNNIMEITYLPVYSPSEAEKADVHLYADNVRQKMAK
jgi:lysophosphatidylcholine acyltransferase/lyso-PAF acetyltransferase